MPERLRYAHLFTGNPFAGKGVEETFSLLHWGNRHEHLTEIDAPEPLVMVGMMAALALENGAELRFKSGEAFLAMGHRSNRLYVVPRKNNKPVDVPAFSRSMRCIGKVVRTDYLSTKGGNQEHYYYHEHEHPFPTLYTHPTGVGYLRPARHNGKASYAVGKEGIVG